jgi:hypothetical protein
MRSRWLAIFLGLLVGCATPPSPSLPVASPSVPASPLSPSQSAASASPSAAAVWRRAADAPIALTEVAVAAHEGQVWVAGGFREDGSPSDATMVYDPESDTWSDGPTLPEPIHHAALVSNGDTVVLVGGYVGEGFDQPTNRVLILAVVGPPAWVDWEPLPEPRAAGAAAATVNSIVYGGGVGPGGVRDEVFELGPDRRWREIATLSVAREHLAAAGEGNRVWFLGGRQGSLETNLATVDLLTGNSIRQLDDLPTPRGGVAAFWLEEVGACLAGGESPGGTHAEVECSDQAGEVTVLADLAEPRHGLGAAVVDGVVYLVSGGTQPGLSVSATVEVLEPAP